MCGPPSEDRSHLSRNRRMHISLQTHAVLRKSYKKLNSCHQPNAINRFLSLPFMSRTFLSQCANSNQKIISKEKVETR